jgi:hypothetical protein
VLYSWSCSILFWPYLGKRKLCQSSRIICNQLIGRVTQNFSCNWPLYAQPIVHLQRKYW